MLAVAGDALASVPRLVPTEALGEPPVGEVGAPLQEGSSVTSGLAASDQRLGRMSARRQAFPHPVPH